MMWKWILIAVAIPHVARAQLTTEEAQRKMQERAAARAATSQPSDDARRLGEVIQDLRREIAGLKDENAMLRKELQALRAQQSAAAVPVAQAKPAKPAEQVPQKGMTMDEVVHALGDKRAEHVTSRADGTKEASWRWYLGNVIVPQDGRGNVTGKIVMPPVSRELVCTFGPDGKLQDFTDSR